jgi:peroxiredoxin
MLSNTTSKIGWKASDFALPAVDGRTYSLADVRGPKGTLVVFICNHCPYVKASIGGIVAEAAALREIGVGTRSRSCRTTPTPMPRIPSTT